MTHPRLRPLPTVLLALVLFGCPKAAPSPPADGAGPEPQTAPAASAAVQAARQAPPRVPPRRPRNYKVVHVFVALCDNRNQGIVKVPAALGNGQDPAGNLYWGAMYGMKTFFAKSPHWTTVKDPSPAASAAVLARAVFRSAGARPSVYVVADAYDGAQMPAALLDFLRAAAGLAGAEVRVGSGRDPVTLQAGGGSDLVAFVGHNGLMDVRLRDYPAGGSGNPSAAVVLACKSHAYFVEPLRRAKCPPLVTTRQFMAPEAYTLDAIVRSWAAGDAPETVRRRAADAYAAYQKCSRKAALGLFVAGWAN